MADIPLAWERMGHDEPSGFATANLLREARRQKGLRNEPVPAICVLDPDGDLVDYLRAADRVHKHAGWACYHTTLETFESGGTDFGIVGRVVGAPFATLVAEELFASGCHYLISMTSAGQIGGRDGTAHRLPPDAETDGCLECAHPWGAGGSSVAGSSFSSQG